MITLFIDTSSTDVSIAILKEEKILARKIESLPNKHSVYTVSFINQVLKEAKYTPQEVEQIMVVTGPGSFTGLRIGVTIAKTFAYLTNSKVIPVSSLKSRSLSLKHEKCLSLIDAHHDNYYIGLYNDKDEEIIPEQFAKKEKVIDLIKKYHPTIISDCNGEIENFTYTKQELDISKIVSYYKDKDSVNPHLVNPNYLKLPQALEELHD